MGFTCILFRLYGNAFKTALWRNSGWETYGGFSRKDTSENVSTTVNSG